MRGDEFLDKMELVDEAFVEAADAKPKKRSAIWVKWGAVAACFSLIVLTGILTLKPNASSRVLLGGIVREYKNLDIAESDSGIEWPWEYKTIYEQYTTLLLNDEEFISRGSAVDASHIGNVLGTYDVTGFDSYTGQQHQMEAEAYQISGVSENRLVAVKLDDDFYVFIHNEYAPPANFGEMLDDYSLNQTLPLNHFTKYDGYNEDGSFSLSNSAYIWEVLSGCRNAEFVEDDSWNEVERAYISFTATSDALGIYKQVFNVTEDGYIWTNIFDYAYIFNIGHKAASEIIAYAAENGTASDSEPYTSSLVGTLIEITDDYILVDDTMMCSDTKDGMVFKIYLDDLRISRSIDFEGIEVGDVVVIHFTSDINTEAGNVVEGAYSMSKGNISDGEVSVPE